jgi:uncharacterized membrane protein YccC
MRLPGKQDWSFSIVTFAAVTLSLYIAFDANLDRPYWAAGTVLIVSQRTAGALNAKALFRLIGTLCGAVFAVAVVPPLVNSPPLLIGALALWIAACLAGSLLDGSLRGYGFMLAGYTAAIIGFPSVNAPGAIFDTALARVEEICLGIACSHLLHAAFLVQNVGASLRQHLTDWMTDLARYSAASLSRGREAKISHLEWRRLAQHVGAIDQLFDQAAYELDDQIFVSNMRRLRQRIRRAVLLVASASARLASLHANNPQIFFALQPLMEEIGQWLIKSVTDPMSEKKTSAARLLAQIEEAQRTIPHDLKWAAILQRGLLPRLHDLVTLWQDSLAALREERAYPTLRKRRRQRRGQLDPLLVVLSSAAVAASLVGVCLFWRYGEWESGSAAAMMAAVAGSIFAHMDDPAPAIGSFLLGNALAVLVAGIYLFGIFPVIDGFPLLIYSLGIFLVPAVALLSQPAFAPWLTPLIISIFPTMSLQETYNADFMRFANNGLASLIGITFTLLITLIMRSVDSETRIQRLLRADRRDLEVLASEQHNEDAEELLDRMLDRFEATASRLGNELPDGPSRLELGDLRASLNLIALRTNLSTFSPGVQTVVKEILHVIANYAKKSASPAHTLMALDNAITSSNTWNDTVDRGAALELVGIRLALFPDAVIPVGLA